MSIERQVFMIMWTKSINCFYPQPMTKENLKTTIFEIIIKTIKKMSFYLLGITEFSLVHKQLNNC